MYMEMDLVLYEKCSRENTERMQQEEMDRKNADTRWDTIMKQVQSILSYLVVIWLCLSFSAFRESPFVLLYCR